MYRICGKSLEHKGVYVLNIGGYFVVYGVFVGSDTFIRNWKFTLIYKAILPFWQR